MKRSQINQLLQEARTFFDAHLFKLPQWGYWTVEQWKQNPEIAEYVQQRQMGWDITDFGLGEFDKKGLILFCIRNGLPGKKQERSYAEKIMVVRENQETVLHFHKNKMEDIINRGGGKLVLELYNSLSDHEKDDSAVTCRVDGIKRIVKAGEPVVLGNGESITLERGVFHRFYGLQGEGTVLVGEVSQVNDDHEDNYFYDRLGRFPTIEEDEEILYPLWTEVA